MNEQKFDSVTHDKIQNALKKASNRISHLTNMKVQLYVEFIPEIIVQRDREIDLLKMENIFNAVSSVTGTKKSEIVSSSRKKECVRARQMTYYFIKKRITHLSLKSIGRIIGGRDHTSVMNGIEKCKDFIETELEYKAQIEQIQQILDTN
jgi:chromosomal replication initiator protein